MPYNPYNPYDFTGGVTNPYQQTFMPKRVIRAVTRKDIEEFQLGPGEGIMLPDVSGKYVWCKTMDQSGIKATIQVYPLGEGMDDVPTASKADAQNEPPIYVTTTEFDKLKTQVEDLVKELKG